MTTQLVSCVKNLDAERLSAVVPRSGMEIASEIANLMNAGQLFPRRGRVIVAPIPDRERDRPVVLYVEDDDLTRERVSARLLRKGVDVIAAASGEQALELCGDVPDVAVAVLDLELPGMTGLETWQRLRAGYPEIVGVVCSGAINDEVRQELEQHGLRSDCCLCKPCRFGELLAALELAREPQSSQS